MKDMNSKPQRLANNTGRTELALSQDSSPGFMTVDSGFFPFLQKRIIKLKGTH